MKYFILALLMCLSTFSEAQVESTSPELPYKDGKVVFETIGVASGSTQQQIYAAAKKWIVENFNSSKAVIQSEDISTGQILGKGIINVPFEIKTKAHNYNLSFDMQIDCKNEKFRLRLYNLIIVSIPSVNQAQLNKPIETMDLMAKAEKNDERWTVIKTALNNKIISLINSFNKEIRGSKKDEF
jgi:hypothetical protein